MNVKQVSLEELDQALASNKTVVVDFFAEWCGPCKAAAPVLDTLAKHYADRATFVKVDVDAVPEAAQRYGVRSIPTFIVLRDGEPAERIVGREFRDQLVSALDA